MERTALLDRILAADAPVVSMCGPAGAGKTSLAAGVAARLADTDAAVAWLGVESRDDDPTRLWTGIVSALRRTGRFPAGAAIHELVPPPTGVPASFVDRVLAEVERLDADVWLVLDDLHQLRGAAAIGTLELLVLHRPSRLRLVLVSRRDPEVGLARLRPTGELLELRADDLAFTHDEVDRCLRTRGIELPPTTVRTLHERTEGWVAGVRIAVLALSHPGANPEVIDAFDGDDHAVAEYLVTEVLGRIPDDTRTFLLETSVCATIDVALARHLTGRADAAAVLDRLAAENAFTLRLGRGREVYRYHELLHTFLRAELRRTDPDALATLHGRAGAWLLDHGDPLHAMEHLLAAGDLDALGDAALGPGVTAILDGRAQEVSALLERAVASGPAPAAIGLVAAAAALALGDRAGADRWLEPGGRLRVPVTGPAATDPVVEALDATVALARALGGPEVARHLAHLETTSAGSIGLPDHDVLAVHHRGMARLTVGRYDEAIADLERVTDLARSAGRGSLELTSRSLLAAAFASAGRLVEMRTVAEAAVVLAERRGWGRSRASTLAYLCLAWAAHLRGDDEEAQLALQQGLGTAAPQHDPQVQLSSSGVAALVGRDGPEGRRKAVRDHLDVLRRTADIPLAPALLAATAPEMVHRSLDVGDRDAAQQLAEAVRDRVHEPGELALVRALLAVDAGRTDLARRSLEPVVRLDVPCHVPTTRVHALVLAAALEDRRGAEVRSHDHLVTALRLAEPVDLVRPFLLDPSTRTRLVDGIGRFGPLAPFVERILAVAVPTGGRGTAESRLTGAETAILADLPSMLSVAEIAAARAVSVNTVKTHLRAIYRKLDVETRRGAVTEARHRGLL